MSDKPWKAFERYCAALIGGKRFPANTGERFDVMNAKTLEEATLLGQCKHVATMPLAELTRLVVEVERNSGDKLGVVFVKLRAGKGVETPALAVMTAETFAGIMKKNGG